MLKEGTQAVIFALGSMCEMALETAEMLEAKGISTTVVNARWIKPLDTETIAHFARGADVVCTMEDHVLMNGFGCAIMEFLSEARITTPVVRIGWPDKFVEHGSVPVLRKLHGLTSEDALEKMLIFLGAEVGKERTAPAIEV